MLGRFSFLWSENLRLQNVIPEVFYRGHCLARPEIGAATLCRRVSIKRSRGWRMWRITSLTDTVVIPALFWARNLSSAPWNQHRDTLKKILNKDHDDDAVVPSSPKNVRSPCVIPEFFNCELVLPLRCLYCLRSRIKVLRDDEYTSRYPWLLSSLVIYGLKISYLLTYVCTI